MSAEIVDILMKSAADMQRLVEEHSWNPPDNAAQYLKEVQQFSQQQVQADEQAVVEAEAALAAAEAVLAAADLAARNARARRDTSITRLEQFGAVAASKVAPKSDKTAKQALRLAKGGVHAAEMLMAAKRTEEENVKRMQENNATIEKQQTVIDEQQATIRRLRQEGDSTTSMAGRQEKLLQSKLDAALAELAMERMRYERSFKMIQRYKQGQFEEMCEKRYGLERMRFEKNVLVKAVQKEMDKTVADAEKLESIRKVVGKLSDPQTCAKFCERMLERSPCLEAEMQENARKSAAALYEDKKSAECVVLKEHEKTYGIEVESEMPAQDGTSFSHAIELAQAQQVGLMLPPARPKRRRTED